MNLANRSVQAMTMSEFIAIHMMAVLVKHDPSADPEKTAREAMRFTGALLDSLEDDANDR